MFSSHLFFFFFFFVLLKGSNILQNFLVWECFFESINETSCYTKDTVQFYFIIGCRKWPHFAFPALTVVFGFQSLHQYKESKSQVRYSMQWTDMKTNDKVGSKQIYTNVQVTVVPLSPCMLLHHRQCLHKICYGWLGLWHCKSLEWVCALGRMSSLLDTVTLPYSRRVCTPTQYCLRCIMYSVLGGANRLTVSLYLDGWNNNCEVLSPPLLLENPNSCRKLLWSTEGSFYLPSFFSSCIFSCVSNPNHNLSLGISTTEAKKALFLEKNQH